MNKDNSQWKKKQREKMRGKLHIIEGQHTNLNTVATIVNIKGLKLTS